MRASAYASESASTRAVFLTKFFAATAVACVLSLVIASALAHDTLTTSSQLFAMPMTRTTISFTREGMKLIQKAARRQGSSVSQFVREAALMRARMASDDNPYPMRALAEELRAIGDQGYALAEKALKVAEDEAERKR